MTRRATFTQKEPAPGYEVFCDENYLHMWAARRVGVVSFDETRHFATRERAVDWTHRDAQENG